MASKKKFRTEHVRRSITKQNKMMKDAAKHTKKTYLIVPDTNTKMMKDAAKQTKKSLSNCHNFLKICSLKKQKHKHKNRPRQRERKAHNLL
jgi:hypothetical protein